MKNRAGNFITQGVAPGFLGSGSRISPRSSAPKDPFFNGKTIRIVGGSGGFYESWPVSSPAI